MAGDTRNWGYRSRGVRVGAQRGGGSGEVSVEHLSRHARGEEPVASPLISGATWGPEIHSMLTGCGRAAPSAAGAFAAPDRGDLAPFPFHAAQL
jgi:hypothetical protein